MNLLVSVDDYCLKKIVIAAALVGVELVIRHGVSSEELESLDLKAKSMVLQTSSGNISGHNVILRYLASISPLTSLVGVSDADSALVNQWLEFSWQELEVPIQLLLSMASGNPSPELALSPEQKHGLDAKAKIGISKTLSVLESHMSSRTFFVGERISIADISFYAAFGAMLEINAASLESFPALYRWYMTTGSLPKVAASCPLPQVAIDASPIACAPSSSCSSSASSTAPGALSSTAPATIVSSGNTGKWRRDRIRVKELLAQGEAAIGQEITVKGWIRTSRSAEKGALLFVELTDGSTVRGVQLVLNAASSVGMADVVGSGGVGASLSVTGLVMASPAPGQIVEVHVSVAEVIGAVYGGDNGEIGAKHYPMAKKQHTLEYLREKAHLRPRSKVFSSAMRMRHAMAFATHKFFNDRGFVYTHTPLITAADCEGAGEQFAVTTLLPEHALIKDIPTTKTGHVDFSKDFFARRCCLTVSGQLNVETHACALSDVYTFGPTFRAENSHTARHLAEFWMIEPEICFADLADDMALAEDYVRYCAAYALEHCADDLAYFEDEYPHGEKGLRQRLRNVAESDFAKLTYTEAIELLTRDIAAGTITFEKIPSWGDDLGSEHERYMAEQVFQRPTIVTDYPKEIKAFYMKLNQDGRTVAAMDILVPKIGELIGGSQREDNLDVLLARCVESGLKVEDIWWYADMRRYGSVPHAGFGLGFERLIMFVTGLENIRDVIPFPRVPGHADF